MKTYVLATIVAAFGSVLTAWAQPEPPDVDFTYSPAQSVAPFSVSVSSVRHGEITSYWWDFGDGSPPVFNQPGASHVYTCPTTYVITLTAFGPGGSDVAVHAVVGTPPVFTLAVDETYSGDIAPADVRVETWDNVRESAITRSEVDWGDGSPIQVFTWSGVGVHMTPYHRFTCPDPVTITVTNYYEGDYCQFSQAASVESSLERPVFTLAVDYYLGIEIAPSQVRVLASGDIRRSYVTRAEVDWGDGSPIQVFTWSGVGVNMTPYHLYTCADPATITVTNFYADSFCAFNESSSTTPSLQPPAFAIAPEYSGSNRARVVTTDNIRTSYITQAVVDWGDSTAPQVFTWSYSSPYYRTPYHTYSNPSCYTIQVTNTYAGPYDTCSQSAETDALIGSNNLQAAFTWTPIGDSCTIQFTNLSTGNPDSYLWDFGDGESSADSAPPPHRYRIGCPEYCVTLTVTKSGECADQSSAFETVPVPRNCQQCARPKALVVSGPPTPGFNDADQVNLAARYLVSIGWDTTTVVDPMYFAVCSRLATDPCIKGLYYVGHGNESQWGSIGFTWFVEPSWHYPQDLATDCGRSDLQFVTSIACFQNAQLWRSAFASATVTVPHKTIFSESIAQWDFDALLINRHGVGQSSCCRSERASIGICNQRRSFPRLLDEVDCPSFRLCDSTGCGSDAYPPTSCVDSIGVFTNGVFSVSSTDQFFQVIVHGSDDAATDTVACSATYFRNVPDTLICRVFPALGRYLWFGDVMPDSVAPADSLAVVMRYDDSDLDSAGITNEATLGIVWITDDTLGFRYVRSHLDTSANSLSFVVPRWGLAGIYDLSSILPPPIITDLVIRAVGNDVVLNWSYEYDMFFNVYADSVEDGTFSTLVSSTAERTVTLNGFAAGARRQFFIVRAVYSSSR